MPEAKLSDGTLNDPPWVVEIDGIKFTTSEAVFLLLKAVSEERDALEAELEQANIAVEEYQDWLKKAEAQVARLREYVRHTPECNLSPQYTMSTSWTYACTCGLEALDA